MKKNCVLGIVFAAAALGLAACGGGGGSAPGNSAAALTADQFNIAATRTFTSAQFSTAVAQRSEFMNENPAPTSSEACLSAKLDSTLFTKSTGTTYTLSVNDTDISSCYQYANATTNGTISLLAEHATAIDNMGNPVDLSTLSFNLANNVYVNQYTMKIRIHLTVTGTGSASGRTVDLEVIQGTHAITGFNDICTNENASNCRFEEVVRYSDNFSTSPAYIDKTVIDTHGLGIVHGAPYYSNGTMTFALNNWTGTMTYNANSSVAPAYIATNGTNNLSGGYTYTGAPSFKSGVFTDAQAALSRIAERGIW